jgi:hypothetical protein
VDRMWRTFRQAIASLRTLNITKAAIDDYLNEFMFKKTIADPLKLRDFTLKILKDYYDLNYLMRLKKDPSMVVLPNICKIESSPFYTED